MKRIYYQRNCVFVVIVFRCLPASCFLRFCTATITTGSDHADAFIFGAILAFPVTILLINIFQPPIAGSLVLCFSIAAILYGLFYAILKTKPNEFEKDRGVFRIGEWRSFFRNRKLLSENCSNLKKEIDYKRWLHARLVLAVHKVEEVADLLAVNLQTLSGIQFEQYLEKVFGVLGYPEVIRTIASGDQGIDLIIGDGRERIAIQAKLYQTSVGNEAVQQAFAGMAHYQCDRCAVITNSIFTKSAFMLSKSTGCKLIDGQLLRQIIAGKERL